MKRMKFAILTMALVMTALAVPAYAEYTGGIASGWSYMEASRSVKLIRAGMTISAISRSTNVVSVTLTGAYPNSNLKTGQRIVISGVTGFNGLFTITAVTDQLHFSYAETAANASGTTDGSSIAGGDYTSLVSWEAAEGGDLVSIGKVAIAECYNDWAGGLAENLIIMGNTTDAYHYLEVTVPASERNNGTPGTGFQISGYLTLADNENVHLTYLEVTGMTSVTAGTITEQGSLYTGGLSVAPAATINIVGASSQYRGGQNAGWTYAEMSDTALDSVAIDAMKIIRAGQTISAISRSANVVSVTLAAAYPNNNLKVGQKITINTGSGGTASFNGTFVIASVTSQALFSYAQTGVGVAGTLGTSPWAGGDYATLSGWETAEGGDLVSGNRRATAECYNDWGAGGLSDNLTLSGNTTDATRYLRISVPPSERHNGTTGTGFKLAGTLTVSDSGYVTVEYLEVSGLTTISAGTLTDFGSLYTGGLSAASGVTLNLGGSGFTNWGTVTLNAASTVVYTGRIDNSRSTVTLINAPHGNITLNYPYGTFNLPANFTINGNLVINALTTLDVRSLNQASTYNIACAGNWTNNGTFIYSIGTVTLTSGGNHALSGSNTFYKLTCDISGDTTGRMLTFAAGTTQTIVSGGTLTLKGGSGKVLTIASSASSAAYLIVNSAATAVMGYLSVSYNDASGGKLLAPTNSSSGDGGNNVNWNFDAANTTRWLGGTSTAWATAANWSAGSPDATKTAVIDGAGTYQPTVSSPASAKAVYVSGSSTLTLNALLTTAGVVQLNTGATIDASGASGAVTVGGNYTQSGGTFTGGATNCTFNGNFTKAGGTFTAPTTATFTGAASALTANGQTFNAMTVNKNDGAIFTVVSGTTITANGALTLTDGSLNTGTVNAKGAVSVASTFDGGTANLILNSAGAQTVTLGAGSALPNVTFNNSNLSVTPAGSLSFYSLTLTSGTYYSSSYTTTITSGDFTVNGGTFDEGTGTVAFTGAGANQTLTADAEVFNNLSSNKPGYALIIAGGTSVTTHGTLTLTDGLLNTGTVNAQGPVSVVSTFDGGTAAITLSGTADQAITLGMATPFTGALTVNKDSGTVTSAGAWTIPGAVAITKGVLSLGGDTTFQDNVTIASGGTLSATTGGKTIRFKQVKTLTVNSGGTLNLYGAAGSLLTLTNNTGDGVNKWKINAASGSVYNIDYVSAFYSDASTYPKIYTSAQSTVDASCVNWDRTNSTWTWVGGASGATTDWNTPTNWSPQSVPGAGADVSIPLTTYKPVLSVSTSIKSLTIDGAGVNLTTNAGANLTVTGNVTLTNGGELKLNSTTFTCGGNANFSAGTLTEDTSTIVMNSGGAATLTLDGDATVNNFTWSGAGTLNFGAANVTVTGVWTQSSGTVNAPSGTLTFTTSNFTRSGGVFNAGTGTVAFTGSGAGQSITADTQVFNHLRSDKNGYSLTVTGGTSIEVDGTLTLTDGTLDTGTVNAKGTVAAASTFDGGTAALILNGSGAQTFTLAAGSALPNVTFNNANLNVTPAGSLSFYGLTLTAGTYHCSSYTTTITGGDFNVNGGTFDEGTGTVAFTGAGANQTITADAEVFNNLSSNKPGYALIVAGGTSIITNGTLMLTDGSLNTGLLYAKGAVSVASTFDGGTAAITLSGTGAQAITLGGGTFPNGAFTINKTSGTATSSGAWTIPGTTTVTQGALSTGAATTFTGAVSVASVGTLSALSDGTFSSTVAVASGGSFSVAGNAIFGDMVNSAGVSSIQGTAAFNNAVTCSGALSVTGDATFSNTVGGAGALSFAGNTTFNDAVTIASGGIFSHTTGGKTLKFKENKAVNIQSGATLTLRGASTSNLLTVDRTGSSGQWSLTMNGGYEFSYLNVKNSLASTDVYATSSTDGLNNNVKWHFVDLVTWNGSSSTDWGTKANWTPAVVPGAGTDVVIPSTGTKPTLGVAATIKSLNLSQAGSQLTLGANLTVLGDITNVGTLLPQLYTLTCGGNFDTGSGMLTASTSTLIMNAASGTKTVTLGASGLNHLTLNGAAAFNFGTADATLSGNFTISSGTGTVTAPSGTITFTGNSSTVDVQTSFAVNGLTINKTSGQTLTIASGDTLTVAGTLTLTDGAVGTGTLDAKGAVSVSAGFDGGNAALQLSSITADQTLNVASSGVVPTGNMTINKSGKAATISGSCALNNVTLSAGTLSFGAGSTYTFTAGKTLNVGVGTICNFTGTNASNRVTLRSSVTDSPWNLTKTGTVNALYVDVKDSNASAVVIANNSVNSGGNTNWSILDLTNWDLDLNAGTMTFVFGYPVDAGTLAANLNVTVQNSNGSHSYVLTGGATASPNGTTIVMNLNATDLNAIKADENIGKSAANSYITITSSLIQSTAGNNVSEILTPKQVRNYTADATAAAFASWVLDMNNHTLTLNFSESVKASSWTPSAVTLQNTASAPTKTYVLTAGSTTASANGTQLVVTLSPTDFNALVDFTGGGLCALQGNSYITMTSSAVTDMAPTPNSLTAVTTGIQAAYTSNTASPTEFYVTTSGASSTSVTAGTAKQITLKAYDSSGYRVPYYSGDKTLTFSGAANSPKGDVPSGRNKTGADINFGSNTVINFSNGQASSFLVLYCKAVSGSPALVKAAEGTSVITQDARGLSVTVDPQVKNNLAFSQEPSSTGIINVALATQPKVIVRDMFWNKVDTDGDSVTIYAYDPANDQPVSNMTLTVTTNPVTATAGTATFAGVKFDTPTTIYLFADCNGVTSASSGHITFSNSATTTVDAATAAVPDFGLIPTNDTFGTRFDVLKFKITDKGGDTTDTKIDRIKIAFGGTGGNASGDIAWAGLYKGATQLATATGAAITNSQITFGTMGAVMDTITDTGSGSSTEYTVSIYMKNSKLAATENDTYTFTTNETLVDVHATGSSLMKTDSSGAIATVTGTIVVNQTHWEIVDASSGSSSLSVTAGADKELILRAVDANKNVDKDYGDPVNGNFMSLVFNGLSTIGINHPTIEGTYFGNATIIKFYGGTTVNPSTGLSTGATLKAFKRETANISISSPVNPGTGLPYLMHTVSADVAAGSPSVLSKTSGDAQVGKTSKALPNPILATVTDTYGNTVSGQTIAFAVSGPGSPSVNPTSALTDSNGQAATILTLGSADGSNTTVTATPTGYGTPQNFTATGRTPRGIYIVSGDGQSKIINLNLDNPLVCKLVDVASGDGNPIPNETVAFSFSSVPSGALNQSVAPSTAVTNSGGQVSTTSVQMGTVTGNYLVRATYGALTKDFTATATSPGATKIVLTGPGSVTAGSPSTAFTITARDNFDNAVAVAQNTVLGLTTSPASTGAFYSDSGCTIPLNPIQVTIANGASTAQFFYKNTAAGNVTLIATRTSGQSLPDGAVSQQAITIIPANINYLIVGAADMSTVTVGVARTFTVTAYDQYNNPSTNAGTVNVTFDTASSSPSGQAPTVNNIAFGSSTPLAFGSGNGQVTASLKLYKVESVVIKATAGSAVTSDANDLHLTVKHGTADHVKLDGNITSPQAAGTQFNFNANLIVVDPYGNLCDTTNGGTAYSGAKDITWSLSGTANSPDGLSLDAYDTPVTFTNGSSSPTVLKATLYRAQNTKILMDISTLPKTVANEQSNTITVTAGAINKLNFDVQPPLNGTTAQLLSPQPRVAAGDQYGNPCSAASGSIHLEAVRDVSDNPANGTLSGTATQALSNGVATFNDISYPYPEQILLKATVAGVSLSPIYSTPTTFATTTDLGVAALSVGEKTAANITGLVSSVANAAVSKVPVYGFKITDAGLDGRDGMIQKIVVHRGAGDTAGDWTAYISDAWITDGTTVRLGTVGASAITFGDGTSNIFTVPNNNTLAPKTYVLSVVLKNPVPTGADGKVLGFTQTAGADITVDAALGSTFAATSAITGTSTVTVVATDLKITGSANSMASGDSVTLTIKAIDANGNIDKEYTGEKGLIFSGANVSANNTSPTCTDTVGSSRSFGPTTGDSTLVAFANGVSSSSNTLQLVMKLYKAEVATISVSDTVLSASTASKFAITVSGGAASQLFWDTQPVSMVAANAPWKPFVLSVADAYGNTSSSTSDITVTPSGNGVHTGAAAMATVTASAGLATFNNFSVWCDSYPGAVTLNATAQGVTASGPSSAVQVDQTYAIELNVKDTVTATHLAGVSLKVQQTVNGVTTTVYGPVTGNSPFNLSLPYGTYTFIMTLDKYMDYTTEEVVGATADGGDGTYDNVIHWTRYMTTLAEATADYRVMPSFVYDEDNDDLYIRLWLERRGKLILNTGTNILGRALVSVYDDVTQAWLPTIELTPPLSSDTVNGTYVRKLSGIVTSVANGFGKTLTSGKTYFAKCQIYYGGPLGDSTLYEAGATFTVTNTQKVGNEIISKLGVPTGQTLGGMMTSVQTAVAGVSTKVDTTTAKVDAIGTQVATVNANVASTGTKIDTVQGTVGAIQTDVSTTLPAKVLANMEKGVMSEILTRYTVLREDDEVKIRYRTASGLKPALTIFKPDGTILADYNGVKMTEINKTGIYEYSVTAKASWGIGDFTVQCSESTKGSTDSMVLTVKALYTAGAGVQESIDAVGEAVSKVYGRQGSIQDLLGTSADGLNKGSIFGRVNGFNTKLDGLNLTTVSTDAKNARENAENIYSEIKNLTGSMGDVKTQSVALKQLLSQLDEMRANLAKASKSLAAVGASSGGGGEVTVSGGTTTIVNGSGVSGSGLNATDEKSLSALLKDAKGLKKSGALGVTEVEARDLNNKIEALTALVKVLGQMVQNTGNKPIIEGWFEQE